jgi:hypothetical protein
MPLLFNWFLVQNFVRFGFDTPRGIKNCLLATQPAAPDE